MNIEEVKKILFKEFKIQGEPLLDIGVVNSNTLICYLKNDRGAREWASVSCIRNSISSYVLEDKYTIKLQGGFIRKSGERYLKAF